MARCAAWRCRHTCAIAKPTCATSSPGRAPGNTASPFDSSKARIGTTRQSSRSNEGFLANKFAKGVSRDALLLNPAEVSLPQSAIRNPQSAMFQNEPPTDFTIAAEREKLRAAIEELRGKLGARHPLVIANRPVT